MPLDPQQPKKQAIAAFLDGQIVDSGGRVALSIKGEANGFKATLEAVMLHWPFGVVYTVESHPGVDASQPPERPSANITIYPRVGRGLLSFFTYLILFEDRSSKIGHKSLDNLFHFKWTNEAVGQRFVNHPGVAEMLIELEDASKFSEVIIRTDAGIFLSQPVSFNKLDVDACQDTFARLAQIAEVLAEAF